MNEPNADFNKPVPSHLNAEPPWVDDEIEYNEESRFDTHPDAYGAIPTWIADILYGKLPGFPDASKEDEIPDTKREWVLFFRCRRLMKSDLAELNEPSDGTETDKQLAKAEELRPKLMGIIQDMNEMIEKYFDRNDYDDGQ
jgi:hypothetical protein